MTELDDDRKHVRAMAWHPRSPATLMIPSVDTTSGDTASTSQMDTFLSHDGVGCNDFETSALMELLDARDAYLQSDIGDASAVQSVSRAYRKALADCVDGWEARLTTDLERIEEDCDQDNKEQENLDLLKIAYAVTHLSETFLLTPSNDSFMADYYENTSSLPGAVTAETVRFLRLHHMTDPRNLIDEPLIDDIENSMQPDQLDGGETYWSLVESYVVKGCLEDAWALLSRHSLRRRAMEVLTLEGLDEYQAATVSRDQEGFRALEALLLSAPLPGGRTDEFDADFVLDEDISRQDELLEGIPPSSHRLWESNTSNRNSGDYPVMFQPNAALQVYHSWQQAVKALPEVQSLRRRIPQLDRILSVMVGDFSEIDFDSWAEELCAELLYKLPNVRLVDMHVRASKIMQKYEADKLLRHFQEVVLSVMRGNAGRVVEVMHQLGGGSGAALPAVMVRTADTDAIDYCDVQLIIAFLCVFLQTSLLCELLDDAKLLPSLSSDFSIKLELLLNASFALRSSFATEGHHDIGTRMVVRFLLPHIKVESDLRITANMVDTLEHHSPGTDAEAKSLLELCRKLVERKNIRVLDGCVSIAVARYRHFLADERPGGAIYWLIVGMGLEAKVLLGDKRSGAWQRALATGVCYRLLVTYCMETSNHLLKGMLGEGEGVSLYFARGKEMCAACDESEIAGYIPAVKVLFHVVSMAEAIAERKDDTVVASSIASCLEERANDEDDGVVSCIARSTMHWDLIRLAKLILDRNAERESMDERHLHAASFDVRSMQVLLEKLAVITSNLDMEGQKPGSSEDIQQIRLSFAEGLMRAFVAENATKQSSVRKTPQISVAGVYAADLGKVSREKQELVVQKMLDL